MDISFQLYSARNYPPLDELLIKLKTLNYIHVEGYGDVLEDVSVLTAALKRSNLSMPTSHFALDILRDVEKACAIATQLNIKLLICPWLEPEMRPKTAIGWYELAGELEQLASIYAAYGLSLAWHNHDFEFMPLYNGEIPMEILLENAPGIGWQFDVAWSVRVGHNPLEWIEKFGKRIVSVHVKDIAATGECADEDGWADVGHGTMNWAKIFATLNQYSSCNSFVVEHDNPNDVIRFATRSIEAVHKLGGEL